MSDNPAIIEISNDRALVQAGWDDVPHLDAATKAGLLKSTEPHLRDARSKGLPSQGVGAIYPLSEDDIKVPYFQVPPYWPRAYALDVGWNKTAAIWGAWDPETGVCYLYSEHYRGQAEPSVHAEAIKARGAWIRGVIDPAARGRAQADGQQLLSMYQERGLDLTLADNGVEAGIYVVWAQLSSGRMKVMSHLSNWFAEWGLYHRDENGKVVKKHDHLMDAMRYLAMSGRGVARTKPVLERQIDRGMTGDSKAGY